MPVQTTIDESLGLAIQEIRGALTLDDILKAQRELYLERGFDPKRPCLWDATRGTVAGAMTGDEMKSAVDHSEAFWKEMAGGRTAILVARDADYGMGRMYEQMASRMPRELQVFRDRDEALAWLQVGSET